jgi:hypothetical protein
VGGEQYSFSEYIPNSHLVRPERSGGDAVEKRAFRGQVQRLLRNRSPPVSNLPCQTRSNTSVPLIMEGASLLVSWQLGVCKSELALRLVGSAARTTELKLSGTEVLRNSFSGSSSARLFLWSYACWQQALMYVGSITREADESWTSELLLAFFPSHLLNTGEASKSGKVCGRFSSMPSQASPKTTFLLVLLGTVLLHYILALSCASAF